MIAYRDFYQRSARPGFFGLGKDDTAVNFDDTVDLANAWIASEKIRVINVETIGPSEIGPPSLRVWYEGDGHE